MASWATLRAWSRSCSDTSFISPSTIMMLSFEAPTMMSMSALFICSKVGSTTYSPFTRATRTSDMGHSNGMSEHASAHEAAKPARASGWSTPSAEKRMMLTNTSAWKSAGKRGRKARSTKRQVRISLSLALPSRFVKPPGKRPAAAYCSLYSTCKGMKSVPGTASFAAQTVASNTVLPMRSTQEPSACFATFPVSMLMVLPSGSETVFVITFI